MIKKITKASLLIAAISLTGCGGESDIYNIGFGDTGEHFKCKNRSDFDRCASSRDCSKCELVYTTEGSENENSHKSSLPACQVSGNTVLVDEGKSCKDGTHTLTCKNNKVTMDKSLTATTININGKTYTCQ